MKLTVGRADSLTGVISLLEHLVPPGMHARRRALRLTRSMTRFAQMLQAFLDRVTGPPFARPLETAEPFVLAFPLVAEPLAFALIDGTS